MEVSRAHQPQGRQAALLGREGEELQKRAKRPRVWKKAGPGHSQCLEERKVAKSQEKGKAMPL